MVKTGFPPPPPYFSLSQVQCESRGPDSRTTLRCEGAQLYEARKFSAALLFLLHPGYGLGHAQRIMAIFPAAERMFDCIAQGCSVLSNLARMAYPKPMGTSATGEKKLISMSWAILDEQEGLHSSSAESC